jgi:hypothetical protein
MKAKNAPLLAPKKLGDQPGQTDKTQPEEEVFALKREIKIKGETYRYVGPANKEILDLLTLLEEQELKPPKNKLQEIYRRFQSRIDTFFAKNFVFFGGRVKINEADFVILICVLATLIAFLAKSNVKLFSYSFDRFKTNKPKLLKFP